MCLDISTSCCFSRTLLLCGVLRASLAGRDAPGWLRTASGAALHSGATSAERSADTLGKYIRAQGQLWSFPSPGKEFGDVSRQHGQEGKVKKGFLSLGILVCRGC